MPDAVYHLMRHTELKTCDLSDNVITKIPPKFAVKFNLITDLNLSHNQMAKLPDEIADLKSLERLDISHNTFISLPNSIFKIPKLRTLNANNNHIVGKYFIKKYNFHCYLQFILYFRSGSRLFIGSPIIRDSRPQEQSFST